MSVIVDDWTAAFASLTQDDETARAAEREYWERRAAQEAAAWREVEAELNWLDEQPEDPGEEVFEEG